MALPPAEIHKMLSAADCLKRWGQSPQAFNSGVGQGSFSPPPIAAVQEHESVSESPSS